MKKDLKEIKQHLESTLEEFSDVYENYGIDMVHETNCIEKALQRVNALLAQLRTYKLVS